MIGRISAALAQFIKPVSGTAVGHSTQREEPKAPFQRFKREKEAPEPTPSTLPAKVVPLPLKSVPAQVVKPSVPHAFILLMDIIKQSRTGLRRILGMRSYREAAAQRAGRLGRYRKGAMIDRKVG